MEESNWSENNEINGLDLYEVVAINSDTAFFMGVKVWGTIDGGHMEEHFILKVLRIGMVLILLIQTLAMW